ncbi:unnamed protein product [Notodromas monacha]|uniref:Eukaryotic translation initiation factor 2A n=1 Tax=Notodromas monacha TaxID=399045 RepID=A0A7R9GAZ7_9CRUS|nr:unnamed protein product [Notodromas monacha]CAG0914556.1 unnamed protein product [Notodromas monacha]
MGSQSALGLNDSRGEDEELVVKHDKIYTTLIRDHNGLGFSIAGGRGSSPFRDDSNAIFISRIIPGGAAEKDGKLRVGDRVLSINGVDMDGARHDQAVSMLTGLERFIRLVVSRETMVPKSQTKTFATATPKPYFGSGTKSPVLSPDSYMANRPSFTGVRKSTTPNPPSTVASTTTVAKPSSPVAPTQTTMSTGTVATVASVANGKPPILGPKPQVAPRTKTLDQDMKLPVAQHPKTSEEFDAFIPPQWRKDATSPSPDAEPDQRIISVTIRQPDAVEELKKQFPEADVKKLGKVTETLTKATFTETTVTRITDNRLGPAATQEVVLSKEGGPLGLSIIGGTDQSAVPYGGEDSEGGVFISNVVPGGVAAASGALRTGDRIQEVNGKSLEGATHAEAVHALVSAGAVVKLLVRHDPLPAGYRKVVIDRLPGEKLGMNVKGGRCGQPGNPLDPGDEGIFVSKVHSNGAVARIGPAMLGVGARLIEVNDTALLGVTHSEAVNALRAAGNHLELYVCDGYDPHLVEKLRLEGKLTLQESKSASQSISSLDDPLSPVIPSSALQLHSPTRAVAPVNGDDDSLAPLGGRISVEKVLDVVRAAEQLANTAEDAETRPLSRGAISGRSSATPSPPCSSSSAVAVAPAVPLLSSSGQPKTTTIVMTKHTLVPQTGAQQIVAPVELRVESVVPLYRGRKPKEALTPVMEDSPPPLLPPKPTVIEDPPPPPRPPKPPQMQPDAHLKREIIHTIQMTDEVVGGGEEKRLSLSDRLKKERDEFFSREKLQQQQPSRRILGRGDEFLSSSSSGDEVGDPLRTSKLPGAKKSVTTTTTTVTSEERRHRMETEDVVLRKWWKPADKKMGDSPAQMSFSAKKKFFEKEIEQSGQPLPRQEKHFSFLSEDEIEKMKQEEGKKIASLSDEQILNLSRMGEDHEEEMEAIRAELGLNDSSTLDAEPSTGASKLEALSSILSTVHTAKAEKRLREKLKQEHGIDLDKEESQLNPAEQRALQAARRAAWREARLKSLEQDALQAQAVIAHLNDLGIRSDDLEEDELTTNEQLPRIAEHSGVDLENNVTEDSNANISMQSAASVTDDSGMVTTSTMDGAREDIAEVASLVDKKKKKKHRGSSGVIVIPKVGEEETKVTLNNTKSCRVAAYSPDGKVLAFYDGTCVLVHDGDTFEEVAKLPVARAHALQFSPHGSFLASWEQYRTTPSNPTGEKNLVLWSRDSTYGQSVAFFQKKFQFWCPQWTSDESVCSRMVNNEIQFFENGDFGKIARKIHVDKVSAFGLSNTGTLATFVPGTKGQPCAVRLFQYPNLNDVLANKSFYKAENVEFKWNITGQSVIVVAQTEVDDTGASYYGQTSLHFLDVKGETQMVQLAKKGPVYAVDWNPATGEEFCVVYGFMPASATLFSRKCEPVFEFKTGRRNTVYFNAFGNMLILAGFGNLRGNIEVWGLDAADKGRTTPKLAAQFSAPDSTLLQWSPDGKTILTATCSPRLKIGNGYKFIDYHGKVLHSFSVPDGEEIWDAMWRPVPAGTYAKPQIQYLANAGNQLATGNGEAPVAAYRPPMARDMPRKEFKLHHSDDDEGPSPSHSKKNNNKKKNRPKKPNASTGNENLAVIKDSPPPPGEPVDKEREIFKKVRQLEKKLKEIQKIKDDAAAGKTLLDNQKVKLAKEEDLMKELQKLKV